jgi:hypothetical protein
MGTSNDQQTASGSNCSTTSTIGSLDISCDSVNAYGDRGEGTDRGKAFDLK